MSKAKRARASVARRANKTPLAGGAGSLVVSILAARQARTDSAKTPCLYSAISSRAAVAAEVAQAILLIVWQGNSGSRPFARSDASLINAVGSDRLG